VGPHTEGLLIAILAHRPHPEQGFRTCLGILRLLRDRPPERVQAVAAHAVQIGALTYRSIASILANRLEAPRARAEAIVDRANIRGPGYFH
jgi:transposase